MYSNKFLTRWAERYIEKSKKEGNKKAREWASGFIPKDAVPEVKKIVEDILGIKRN